MLYLRHEYLTRCEYLDGKYVVEFAPIVNTTARIMYTKLYPNFNKVGFQEEDIVAITNVYMLGYMGLYSLRNNEVNREKFVHRFKFLNGKPPTEVDITKKDRNNMINFLRQRLQHCAIICSRKARNITVGKDRRGFFAETASSRKASNEIILDEYHKFGYRKVTKDEFKEACKKAKELGEREFYDNDGFRIFKIEILNTGISCEDYKLLSDSNKGKFNRNPEDGLIFYQDEVELENYKKQFGDLNLTLKRKKLNRFIENNRHSKFLKKELTLARKWLKNSRLMV